MSVIIRRRRILDYIIDGDTVTIRFSRPTHRLTGTVKIPGRTVVPIGSDEGISFDFTVDPPAEPNEVLDISFSAQYFTEMPQIYAEPLKNITTGLGELGYVGSPSAGYPVIDQSYLLSLLGN